MKREEIQIRDPFVLVENGIYYLIGTTGSDPWGRGFERSGSIRGCYGTRFAAKRSWSWRNGVCPR